EGEHEGRDGEETGGAAGDDVGADQGQPDHAGRGEHARVPAAELRADRVPGNGQAERFGQVPSCGQHQPPGARQLEVLSHGEEHTAAGRRCAGIAGRWRKEESGGSPRLYNVSPVTQVHRSRTERNHPAGRPRGPGGGERPATRGCRGVRPPGASTPLDWTPGRRLAWRQTSGATASAFPWYGTCCAISSPPGWWRRAGRHWTSSTWAGAPEDWRCRLPP